MNKLFFLFSLLVVLVLSGGLSAQVGPSGTFDQAYEAYRSGNYKSAELLLQDMVENRSGDVNAAWFLLAKSIYKQKRYPSAIYEFNRYVLFSSDEKLKSESRFWIAESYNGMGEKISAIEEYKRYIGDSHATPQLISASYRRVGAIYFDQGRYEEAIEEWERARENETDELRKRQINLEIAGAYLKLDRESEALGALKSIFQNSPADRTRLEALLLAGQIHQKQGNHKKALELFNFVENNEDSTTGEIYSLYYFRSISFRKINNPERALDDLEKFAKNGGDSDYYYNGLYDLARMLRGSGDDDRALLLAIEIIDGSKSEELTLGAVNLGMEINGRRGEPEKSVQWGEEIKGWPVSSKTREAYLNLALAYADTGRLNEAEKLIYTVSEKLRYDPSYDRITYIMAYIYLLKKSYSKALAKIDETKSIDPFTTYAAEREYILAVRSYDRGQLSLARKTFTRYLRRKDRVNRLSSYYYLLQISIAEKNSSQAKHYGSLIIREYPESQLNIPHISALVSYLKKNGQSSGIYEKYLQSMAPGSSNQAIIDGNGVVYREFESILSGS
jgi:tetratricopeptide (TPR) repeat protein